LTPRMAEAIAGSGAAKFVLPVTQENLTVVGRNEMSIPQLVGLLVDLVEKETDRCAR